MGACTLWSHVWGRSLEIGNARRQSISDIKRYSSRLESTQSFAFSENSIWRGRRHGRWCQHATDLISPASLKCRRRTSRRSYNRGPLNTHRLTPSCYCAITQILKDLPYTLPTASLSRSLFIYIRLSKWVPAPCRATTFGAEGTRYLGLYNKDQSSFLTRG